MNIKSNLTVIFFVALTLVAGAADKPQSSLTVAVYDFTDADKEVAGLGGKVTTLVTANLTTETNLVMLERAELTKALTEQAFGISGMVSSDAAAKVGQITGVKVLVTGQVMKTAGSHLVIVARIIGAETGRLFTAKAEGDADKLMELTSDLSRKIGQTITVQATNLVMVNGESHEDRVDRMVKNLKGKNRPTVSVSIGIYGVGNHDIAVEGALGAILLKAGFAVVDAGSERKPDVEITGSGQFVADSRRAGVCSSAYGMDVKIQERRTGSIIAFDRQESTASASGAAAARTAAQVKTVDDLAERILPLLAE